MSVKIYNAMERIQVRDKKKRVLEPETGKGREAGGRGPEGRA